MSQHGETVWNAELQAARDLDHLKNEESVGSCGFLLEGVQVLLDFLLQWKPYVPSILIARTPKSKPARRPSSQEASWCGLGVRTFPELFAGAGDCSLCHHSGLITA